MTNLEKWVLSQTQDDFIKIISGMGCKLCPAKKYCKANNTCEDIIKKWALEDYEKG